MNKEIDLIKKYAPYFHDGALINIENRDNSIELSLESAEINKNDLSDYENKLLEITDKGTLKGKLFLHNVKKISINKEDKIKKLEMPYKSYGNIFSLEISDNEITLEVIWEDIFDKSEIREFSTIKIGAENIDWESLPELRDPFW